MKFSAIATLLLLATVGSLAHDYADAVVPQDTIDAAFSGSGDDVRFTTLALLEQMDKSPEFLQSKDKNIIKGAVNMVKGAINKAGKFVKAKAGEYCRTAIKDGQKSAPTLFKKAGNLCKTAVCPVAIAYINTQFPVAGAVVSGPLKKLCVSGCDLAVKSISKALSPQVKDKELADKICKAVKLEVDEEMLQASDEALAEAKMDLQDSIDDDFEGVDSDVRFTTLALLEQMDKSPEFLQSKNKNIIKKGIAMAKGAIKFVKGKAGEYCRTAIKTGQKSAPGLFKKAGNLCKDKVCPAAIKYINTEFPKAGAVVSGPLKKLCVSGCDLAVKSISKALSPQVK